MAHETCRRNRRPVWMVAAILFSALPLSSASAQGDSALDTALHFFTRSGASGIVERFESALPAPVTPAELERVLATLPAKGEVSRLDAVQRQKLTAVRRVLELHGREAVYVIKIIELPRAFVGLHARAIVLISEPALDLLDAEELQALVAHEVGHEYFWSDYFRARHDDDRRLLRTLELLCDGFAIVTLRRAGTDPGALTSALERVIRYNRARFGAALNEDHYPAIGERRSFAKHLIEWLGPEAISRVLP
jgi:hypothetical protein